MQSMLPDTTDMYWSIALALAPAILGVLGIIVYRFRRLRNWLSGRANTPSEGVQKTFTASLDGGLPLDLSLIAGAGRKVQAPQSLNETYLRPTIGLRFIMFGFPVVLYFILQSMQATNGFDLANDNLTQIFALSMVAVMVHNIIYFNIYELRYGDTCIVHRTWFYQRLELPVSRLLSIRDDGMYFYILRTDTGKKAYVPKHLIGIEDFVRYVRASIAKNEAY